MSEAIERRVLMVFALAAAPVLLAVTGYFITLQADSIVRSISSLQTTTAALQKETGKMATQLATVNVQFTANREQNVALQRELDTITRQNADQEHRIIVLEQYHR